MKPDRDSIHRRAIRLGAVAFMAGLGFGSVALAHELGELVLITQPVHEDLYVAGEAVEIRAAIAGDLTVAGQTVTVDGRIMGDVAAAGNTVALGGELLDDVRVGARSLTVTGRVGDHIAAGGETLVLADSSHVGGFAWLAGNRVDVLGDVGGDLVATGQRVTIAGTVRGNASIDAANAVIQDGAHIHGDLTWPAGHAPEIGAGARVDGRRIETTASGEPGGMAGAPGLVTGLILGTLSLLMLTLVLRAVVPPVMLGAKAHLRARPGLSAGVGLLALILLPAAAALAFVTIVGVPLGLVLSFVYVVLVLIGVPVALDLLVDLALGRARRGQPLTGAWRLLALALASLGFVALLQIPVVGLVLGLVALVFGLGALVLRAMRRTPMGGMSGTVVSAPVPAAGLGGA